MDVQASLARGGLKLRCRSCPGHVEIPEDSGMFDIVNAFLAHHRGCRPAAPARPWPQGEPGPGSRLSLPS